MENSEHTDSTPPPEMGPKVLEHRPGMSPLGCAAFAGHWQLAQLYLDYEAEPSPNDRGEWPEDLARNNHHHHLMPLLATFAT